jgi:hypothetical protein
MPKASEPVKARSTGLFLNEPAVALERIANAAWLLVSRAFLFQNKEFLFQNKGPAFSKYGPHYFETAADVLKQPPPCFETALGPISCASR